MKTYIVSKIKKEKSFEIDRIGIRIEITEPELISQIIKKNNFILYTEEEYNELKKERDYLSERSRKMTDKVQKIESWFKTTGHTILFNIMKKAIK